MRAGREFRNWARNQACTPGAVFRPDSVDEIVDLLAARAPGEGPLRVVGAGHSWSDAAMTDDARGALMQLDGLPSSFELDETRAEASFSGGMRLREINAALDARGWALPILGSVAEQSFAGAASTGTHGSSLRLGNLASGITGMELITGRGERLWLDRDDPRLDAARVGLGALGIVTRVRVRVRRAFRLRETLERLPFDEGLEQLEARARAAEFLKVWWLPPSDDLLFFEYAQTQAPSNIGRIGPWLDEVFVNRHLFDWILRLSGRWPALTPGVNRIIDATRFAPAERVGRSDLMFTLPMPPRHRETEYALPFERSADLLRSLRDIVGDTGVRVNFIQELRFVRGDPGWLSPAHGRDTVQLGAYMAESPELASYFAAFEAAMQALEGRPHWGKEFALEDAPTRLQALYPRYGDFVALVDELDPEAHFRNAFLRRILPS